MRKDLYGEFCEGEIAPGLYAILIPLMVGFTIGPKCLMGVLAGAISCGCMNAIMMSNAGGAWDNSKKLCEKLQIKKTDQGKACVVGDTVGDPFKDTSGPALNILIKLMSMVSLTIAPLVENHEDWEDWMYGMAPTAIFVVASVLLSPLVFNILGWSDPLKNLIQNAEAAAPTNGGDQKQHEESAPREEMGPTKESAPGMIDVMNTICP